MGHHKKAVFISSTAEDLKEVRHAVIDAMRHTSYLDPVGMEYFGADPRSPQQMCEEKVRDCSIFLGIIGDRRGWEPDGDHGQRSITQIEYDTALEENIPPYMAILPEGTFEADEGDEEDAEKQNRHQVFRTQLLSRHGCIVKFENKDKLAGQLVSSITNKLVSQLYKQHDQSTLTDPLPPEIESEQLAALKEAAEQHFIDPEKVLNGEQEIDDEALIEQFWQEAELSHEKAIEYYKYVGALAFNSHTQKAFEAYKRVVELVPDDPEGWNQYGTILMRLGETMAAKEAYEKVIKIGNEYGNKEAIHLGSGNLGIIFMKLGDFKRAKQFHQKALALAKDQGWHDNMADQLSNIGVIHLKLGDLEVAEDYLHQALDLNKLLGRNKKMAAQLGNLGLTYQIKGDLKCAEKYHRQAFELEEECLCKQGMAAQLSNLAIIFHKRGDLTRAEEYFNQSYVFEKELERKEGMACILGNLGLVYRELGNLERAEISHRQALKLDEETGVKEGIVAQLCNLGMVYNLQNRFELSEIYYRRALVLNEEMGRNDGMAIVFGNLGSLYKRKGELCLACQYWQRALSLFTKIGMQLEIAQTKTLMELAGCSDQK